MEQDRLSRCPQCGEMKGEALVDDEWEGLVYVPVLCLCDGIVCRYCKKRAIHRPISDYYVEATGRTLHVSYFGNLFPCPDCREKLIVERGDGYVVIQPSRYPGSDSG